MATVDAVCLVLILILLFIMLACCGSVATKIPFEEEGFD